MRRYNADLANDFGNLVNRTSRWARFLDGERPAPRRRAVAAGEGWAGHAAAVPLALDGFLLDDALGALWEFVAGANSVDAEQPWTLAKEAKDGDGTAAARLRGVLGDLLEACRLVGLAAAPFMPGDRAASA